MTSNILGMVKKTLGWCPLADFSLKSKYAAPHNTGPLDRLKGNVTDTGNFATDEEACCHTGMEEDEIDVVSIGLVIIITGFLIILFAPFISVFSMVPVKAIVVQDKYSQIPNVIYVVYIRIFGALVAVVGFALFLRNLINLSIDNLIQRLV